jgi:hypothetical protein
VVRLPPGGGHAPIWVRNIGPVRQSYRTYAVDIIGELNRSVPIRPIRSHRYISCGDGQLIVLSLVNLFFVTLHPVTASIVGTHPLEPLASVCPSVNSMLYRLSAWAV